MTAPWWLLDGLAAIMLAIAAYCAIRPVAARHWSRYTERDVDAAHVLMGVAMAAMLMPGLDPLGSGAWTPAFAVASAWFAGRVFLDRRRRLGRPDPTAEPGRLRRETEACTGHHGAHLLSCGSMLYMLLATSATGASIASAHAMTAGPSSPGTAGHAVIAPGISALAALALAAAMAGSVVISTDRLAFLAPAGSAPSPPTGLQAPARPHTQAAPCGLAGQCAHAGPPAPADLARRHMPVLCPRLAASCQIVMGITMVYLLIQML
jgi:hypothetical protein